MNRTMGPTYAASSVPVTLYNAQLGILYFSH
jgi:hypothetical protein